MRTVILFVSIFSINVAFGAETIQHSDLTAPHGVVYYLDGAGGGSLLTNWAPGVRKGLKQGGVHGEFKEFIWQTGLGVLADQTASVKYKRDKAKILADRIVEYKNQHPHHSVSLIGLSAGTAVTLFTLEALPESCQVDRVFLLGSSVDANYDVSRALTHITKDLIVYTSPHDEILTVFVPMTGSADRHYVGTDVVGLKGFHQPANADILTQALYTKIKTIPWTQRFSQVGDHGRHTDKTNPRFVSHYIAPLVRTAGSLATLPEPYVTSADFTPLVWDASNEPLALVD